MIFLPLRQRHEYMWWIFRFRRSGAAVDLTEARRHGGAGPTGTSALLGADLIHGDFLRFVVPLP